MGNKIAIVQSNYLPWKGYFDMIHEADTFVFLDDVQYTKNDWRNRNRIKTRQGLVWLTVPVIVGGKSKQLIRDARIDARSPWQRKHWASIQQSYGKLPHFDRYRDFFSDVYENRTWEQLSELNQFLVRGISELLGITTQFIDSSQLDLQLDADDSERKIKRIVEICRSLQGDLYISGPAARSYMPSDALEEFGIKLEFKDYSGYPEYEQQHGSFEHAVSIIDLLFAYGEDAKDYIWTQRYREEK